MLPVSLPYVHFETFPFRSQQYKTKYGGTVLKLPLSWQ